MRRHSIVDATLLKRTDLEWKQMICFVSFLCLKFGIFDADRSRVSPHGLVYDVSFRPMYDSPSESELPISNVRFSFKKIYFSYSIFIFIYLFIYFIIIIFCYCFFFFCFLLKHATAAAAAAAAAAVASYSFLPQPFLFDCEATLQSSVT